jgi:DNA-binding NarL/FixJ family response regulator
MTFQVDHNGLHPAVNHSRIVIVDDHPLFRLALVQMLETPYDLEVVGQATDGREAVELCRRLRPDLVLMDITMPVMDGVEATRAIKGEFPLTIVMVLTASAEPNELSRALEAGAAGYVLKGADPAEVIDAIRQVLLGEYFLNREVATRLLVRLLNGKLREDAISRSSEGFPGSLSPRELDVLRLIAQGYTNQQIARELFLSMSTVKKHVHSVISKLGVSDRTQAAVHAVELGALAEHDKE